MSIYLVERHQAAGPDRVLRPVRRRLLRNTVTQMVYKHAISTIVPGRAGELLGCRNGDAAARLTCRTARRARAAVRVSDLTPACPHHCPLTTGAAVLVGRRPRAARISMPNWRNWACSPRPPGLEPVARVACKRKAPDAALFVGSGKADEIEPLAEAHRRQRGAVRPGAQPGAAAQPRAPSRRRRSTTGPCSSWRSSPSARAATKASCRSSWRGCST